MSDMDTFESKLEAYNAAKAELERVRDLRGGMTTAEYLPHIWAAKAVHRAALKTMLADWDPTKAPKGDHRAATVRGGE